MARGGNFRGAVDAGTVRPQVRVSTDLARRVELLAREQRITASQLWRLGARLLVDAPDDVVRALVADPTGQRTRIVARIESVSEALGDTTAA